MPLVFKYHQPGDDDQEPGYVDLGDEVVRWGTFSLSQLAGVGEPAISGLELDDPYGELDIVGLRAFRVYESSAPSNSQLMFTGRIGDRTVRRMESYGSNAVSRRWSLDLMDANWYLGNRLLVDSDSKRPEETGGDRLRWLLNNAAHIYLHDHGHVDYPTNNMDACDYRGQTSKDVLTDISTATGYNFWCDVNEAHNDRELFFMSPTSSEYTSAIRISNDLDDVDWTTTFPPGDDAELKRSPSRIAFGVYVPYAKGSVYVRNQATGAAFAKVDQTAPNSNIKKASTARNYGTRFLNDNDEEDDKITCWILVPAAQVNDLRAGHLTAVKFTHLPGYETFTYMRVLNRTVTQDPETAASGYYRIDLELSPTTPPLECSTSILTIESSVLENQTYVAPGTFSHSITPTPGSDYALIGVAQAVNHNIPPDYDLASSGAWTDWYETLVHGTAHPDTLATWRTITSASGSYTLSGTYTPGYSPVGDSYWSVIIAAIRTSATAPVQEKHDTGTVPAGAVVTLDTPPTAGNMLVLCVGFRDEPEPDQYPSWHESKSFSLLAVATTDGDCCAIYARCVGDGESATYGMYSVPSWFVSLSEWQIT